MATTITGTTIDVGTNVIVTDAAGKVGVGTASPANYYADELVVTAADEGGMTLVTGTGHANYIAFADGTSGNAAYRGFVKYDHANDKMTLGTAGTSAIEVNNDGIVTKPLQPAFSAYRTLGNVTSGVYICNLTHFNTGGHYSTSTGRFTAPVAGRYTISSMLMSQTDNTYTNKAYTIRVNDSNYKEVYGSSGSAVHHQFVWSGIIELAANDYVTLNYQNFTMYGGGSTYSTFSGHLIG